MISTEQFNWSFGLAIGALKAGQRVARTGWNGKGMWLALVKHDLYFDGLPLTPFIVLKTPANTYQVWNASQADALADDWGVVDDDVTPTTETTGKIIQAEASGVIVAQRADTTEQAIQAAGADVAPRVTLGEVEAIIVSEHYFTASDGLSDHACVPKALSLLTFCVLVLRNGFTVTGESACASHENFNAEIGRQIARENAIDKIWPLLGYELRSKLAKQ